MSYVAPKNNFDPRNPRVHLAREKNRFDKPVFTVLRFLLFLTLLAGGIVLLFFKNSLGWIFIGFSVWPLMMLFWAKNAFISIPTNDTENFTDLIAEDLLTTLKANMTSADLVRTFPNLSSSSFMMARFELSPGLFERLIEYLPETIEPICESAREIYYHTNSEAISGAILVVAVIENLPEYEKFLSQFKLDINDLYQGIAWYNYLSSLSKNAKKKVHSGGIARDFAFGYIPTLQRFAINYSERYYGVNNRIQQAENYEIIDKIIHNFSHGGRQNVALIGAYGSGKTTILNNLAQTLLDPDSKISNDLKFRQIYVLDVPSLISEAKNQGELEYLLIRIFNEIYSAKNIILCLKDAHLFFEEGPGSIDISNFLTPIIQAGNIRMIFVMDDQRFLKISVKNPVLANSLNKIMVHPSNEEETIKILMDQAPRIERQKNVIFTFKSLTTAYRLSEQYIHDVVMPGKARLLLESAAPYSENGLVTENSVQTAVENSYGVKIKVTDNEEERKKLLDLESLIHERMVDQEEAVSVIASALRRAGAGIKNQKRPIGTFLFLGPTGVGKTELAKTLSEVYFNGENHIIRLDMNEFVTSNDATRLLMDGSVDEFSLTAQVMKQPFSVILLDEIEKAHPAVLATLLQVLDEGILRDENNREISFRDSIIIATSNAGANIIREKISNGENISDFKDELTEQLIRSGEFKPEFLNRFDEICLFKPLSKDDLVKILDLIVASTNKTLESQKISVTLTPEAKQVFIEQGYDPKMGARPMRRIVQKVVEDAVATAILSGRVNPGNVLTISPSEISIS